MEKRRKILLTLNSGELNEKIIKYINKARTNPKDFGRMILSNDNENDYSLRDLALYFNKNPFEEDPLIEDKNLVISAKKMIYKFILVDDGSEIINLSEKDKNDLKLQKRLEELNKYSKYYKEFIVIAPESAFDVVINLLLVEKYKKLLLSPTIKYIGVASNMLPSERICVIIDIVDNYYDKKDINSDNIYDNYIYSSIPFKHNKLNILTPKKISNGIKFLNRSISPSNAVKLRNELSPSRKFNDISNCIADKNHNLFSLSKNKNEEKINKLRNCLSPREMRCSKVSFITYSSRQNELRSTSPAARVDSIIHFKNDNDYDGDLKYVMNASFQVLSNNDDTYNEKKERTEIIDKNINNFTFSSKKDNSNAKTNNSVSPKNIKKYIKKNIGNNKVTNNNIINRTKGKIIPIYSKQKTLKDGSLIVNFFPLDQKLKDY